MGREAFRRPVPFYRRAFLKAAMNDNGSESDKTNPIFVSFIRNTSRDRDGVPSGRKLGYEKYLDEISRSHYVTSPNGDRPDCHRHYEALGLGAIPITQMDPSVYTHLKDQEGIIYNNTNWNLKDLEKTLPFPAPEVNRNVIFEEYWMEYVEQAVGRRLWWWDVVGKKRSKIADLASLPQLDTSACLLDADQCNFH